MKTYGSFYQLCLAPNSVRNLRSFLGYSVDLYGFDDYSDDFNRQAEAYAKEDDGLALECQLNGIKYNDVIINRFDVLPEEHWDDWEEYQARESIVENMEYIIVAQVGSEEDWTWDIVDRVYSFEDAKKYHNLGARVFLGEEELFLT